jgi:hypothetical protein
MRTNPIRYWSPKYHNWRIGWIITRGPKWVTIKTIKATGYGTCKIPAAERWMINFI